MPVIILTKQQPLPPVRWPINQLAWDLLVEEQCHPVAVRRIMLQCRSQVLWEALQVGQWVPPPLQQELAE